MNSFYLVASGQPNDRAIYYTGHESFHGGELWGNVEDAYMFNDMNELASFLVKRNDLRLIIIKVSERTAELYTKGYHDCLHGIQSSERELYHKYNKVSYITNSERN